MDRQAFEALIRTHQAELYRYVRYLGAAAHEAEDLVQETFLAALDSPRVGQLVEASARAAYLRGIARNVFLLACRRRRANPVRLSQEAAEAAEAFWQSEFLRGGDGFDYVEALRACLATLSERDREFLRMHYAERRGRAEMARVLEMTVEGVKTLARRLRARLAECIRRRLRRAEAAT